MTKYALHTRMFLSSLLEFSPNFHGERKMLGWDVIEQVIEPLPDRYLLTN